MSQLIQQVCLLVAMEQEAEPIIAKLGLDSFGALNPKLPMMLYQGQLGKLKISLVQAGLDERFGVDYVGTESATLMAQQAIENLQPDVVISAGTAGGFKSLDAEIGTIILSDGSFVYHDHHVPLPGLYESAIGRYPACDVSAMGQALGYQLGIISSGSSLEKQAEDIRVIKHYQAKAKEMEAAAIAWIAMLYSIPCMAIKSITNLVDEDNNSEQEFVKNFETASSSLTSAVFNVLSYMDGKSIQDLSAQ